MCSIVKMTLVLPTYNRENALIETLQKIFLGRVVPSEIILIDQSDRYDIGVKISTFFGKQEWEGRWILHKLDVPSTTKARNEGIKYATNDIIVFMDDDVAVEKETFGYVEKYMRNNNIAMIGGVDKLAESNGNLFPYVFGMRSWRKRNQGHVVYSMFGRYPTEVKKVVVTEWAMGYFFVVRKSLIIRWKLKFDEKLGEYAYAEDLDFTYAYYKNARKEGLSCILTPEIKVSHLCSKEWRVASKRLSYLLVFNRCYLMEKHFGTKEARVLFWWANLGLIIKKMIQKDNVKDFIDALKACRAFQTDIQRGAMHEELYGE